MKQVEYYEFPNPAYDPVFKFLMADNKVAMLIISTIIGIEVVELFELPTEYQLPENQAIPEENIKELRLDYIAMFKNADGSKFLAVIEMQKNFKLGDVERYRKYIGVLYKGEKIPHEYKIARIYGIFIMGYVLSGVEPAITRTKTVLIDVENNNEVEYHSEFVDGLMHVNIFVQLPKTLETKNNIGMLFKVFDSQRNKRMVKLATQDAYVRRFKPVIDRLLAAGKDERVLIGLRKDIDQEVHAKMGWRKFDEEQIKREEAERNLAIEAHLRQEAERQKEEAERQKVEAVKRLVTTLHLMGKTPTEIAPLADSSESEVEAILQKIS